jgi:hypothetical protein
MYYVNTHADDPSHLTRRHAYFGCDYVIFPSAVLNYLTHGAGRFGIEGHVQGMRVRS